jgi:hypothetical protein
MAALEKIAKISKKPVEEALDIASKIKGSVKLWTIDLKKQI